MKRTVVYTASLLTLLLLAFSISARAEVLTASVQLTPGAEVNPSVPPPADASGRFLITVNVTRDSNGAVTAGAINFLGTANFPGGATITVVGLHIHEGAITANGPVVFNTGLSGTNPLMLTGGVGLINLNAASVDVAILGRMLAKPAGFYVNLHTSANQAGAIRAQIIRLVETVSNTVAMTTAEEVNPPTPLPMNASGTGTITVNPIRNPSNGVIIGGTVTFTIQFDIPANSVIAGLHIHRGASGANGPVEINTRLSGTNNVTTATGKGTISIEVPITNATTPASEVTALKAMQDLVLNPTGFYVNLHTQANGAGVVRGQLTAVTAPLVIQQSDTLFLETGATDAQIRLVIASTDLLSIPTAQILVNGQMVTAPFDLATGGFNVTIPAALRANAGTLFVQARNTAGVMSAPVAIAVAPAASVNTVPAITADAARYGTLAAPDTIVAGFGTRLASQTVAATGRPLPTSLDGTSVFVNGIAARLFFVSGNQANYLIPSAVGAGPAAVVVVARDGTVSRGQLNVSQAAPGIFTTNTAGTGAPAALASLDGMPGTFNILMGNPDGTPREIGAGNFVMLFATGVRHGSTAATNSIKIGTTDVTPMFAGSQGDFFGLDQINLQVPMSLAGAGEVNLTYTVDGKTSNPVRLKIR